MGSPPLLALDVQQPPSILDQASKLTALKSALMNQQFQQQAQPLELQQRQQATQSGVVDLQMKQLGLKNRQLGQAALSDPNFEKDFADWQSSKQQPNNAAQGGAAPQPTSNISPGLAGGTLQLHPLAQFLVEKKGLPLFGPEGAMDVSSSLTGAAQKIAELAKTQGQAATAALENHGKQLDNFDNLVEPILTETDPAKQQQQITNLQSEIKAHPDLYPAEATQHLDKLGTVQAVQFAANTSKVRQMVIDDATKQAEAEKAAGASNPQSPFYAPSSASVAMGTAPGAAQIQAGEAAQAGLKARSEAAARQPFEVALAKARQAIQDGDPKAAGQLLANGDVAPSQIASARKPEFAQAAFQAAHDLTGGTWNAQKAEADFKVASSPANLAFFGSRNP